MLIPSIDLMGGKIVQLVQGERKALEFDSFEPWIERFARYPTVQLIDLDAAKGEGTNAALVEQFCRRLPCQVGGGVRTVARAKELIERGARSVIIGSSLVRNGKPDRDFAASLAAEVGAERFIFAVDSRGGRVVISGWKETTALLATEMMGTLDQHCGGFLYTNVDTEGLMKGFPTEIVSSLKNATNKRLIVAGGIRTMDEVNELDAMGADCVVGMAIYTGKMQV